VRLRSDVRSRKHLVLHIILLFRFRPTHIAINICGIIDRCKRYCRPTNETVFDQNRVLPFSTEPKSLKITLGYIYIYIYTACLRKQGTPYHLFSILIAGRLASQWIINY